MNYMQWRVREFHDAMGATIGEGPAIRDRALRVKLILEEAFEFMEACGLHNDGLGAACDCRISEPNLVAAVDALCDLLYVTFGAAVAFGVDLSPFFDEVHRSNMTKVGGPVREDGKVLKPDTYEPPNLLPELVRQQMAVSVEA
jgi:predicted HAD superfamily Cof-like phosphohydrolase